jgi:NarL family two-component system response regulator LiaR
MPVQKSGNIGEGKRIAIEFRRPGILFFCGSLLYPMPETKDFHLFAAMFPGYGKQVREALFWGSLLACLLYGLTWLESRFLVIRPASGLYGFLLAGFFLLTGLGLARLVNKKTLPKVLPEPTATLKDLYAPDEEKPIDMGLTRREMEVLQLMAQGNSNQEIADRLHVSLSTIKTHASSILDKLESNRRTQAIEKARKLGMVP